VNQGLDILVFNGLQPVEVCPKAMPERTREVAVSERTWGLILQEK
jgi:hypothetical protein